MKSNVNNKYVEDISILEDKKLRKKMLKQQSKKNSWSKRKVNLRKFNTKYKKFFKILLFFVVIVFGLWVLDKVGATKISNITIVEYSGGEFSYIDKDALKEILELNLNEVSYYHLKDEQIKSLIYSSTPYSKSVTIEKLFPSSVKVSIMERVPVLTIISDDKCGVIDETGLCLAVLTDGASCADLSVSTATKILQLNSLPISFKINKVISFYDIEMLIMTTKMIEQNGYLVQSYEYSEDKYIFKIESGQQIIFTRLESFELQQKRMLIALSEVGNRKIDFEILDVRYERPVITPK